MEGIYRILDLHNSTMACDLKTDEILGFDSEHEAQVFLEENGMDLDYYRIIQV